MVERLKNDLKIVTDGMKRRRTKAGDVIPPAQKKGRHNPNLESKIMPIEAYPILWTFLLDCTSNTSDGCFVDFKSIASLMLVSRASKEAFHACRGWWMCAQALKREAEAKRELIRSFCWRGHLTLQRLPGDTSGYVTWCHEIQRMMEIDAHIICIHSELLPQACHLALSYDGDKKVTMDPYRSAKDEMFMVVHDAHQTLVDANMRLIEAHGRALGQCFISYISCQFWWLLTLVKDFYSLFQ